jgi:hypothetical protein
MDQIPVGVNTPVQAGPGAHIASYLMGTGSFPGNKPTRGVALNTHLPSSAEVRERVQLYLYSPSVPSQQLQVKCYLLQHVYGTMHIVVCTICVYRGADKSLTRPGRKQATVTKL